MSMTSPVLNENPAIYCDSPDTPEKELTEQVYFEPIKGGEEEPTTKGSRRSVLGRFSRSKSKKVQDVNEAKSIRTSASIETEATIEVSEDMIVSPPQPKPLKSCLSSSNLADLASDSSSSSGGMGSRLMSAPNLAAMGGMKRNVSFQKIEVREYERTLGDNPCVRSGPPISLGWDYSPEKIHHVDDYEAARPTRRTTREMAMNKKLRTVILKEYCGVSYEAMHQAGEEASLIRRQRKATNASTPEKERRDEKREAAARRAKRILTRSSEKKDEEKLWKNAAKHKPLSSSSSPTMRRRTMSMNDLASVAQQREEELIGKTVVTTDEVPDAAEQPEPAPMKKRTLSMNALSSYQEEDGELPTNMLGWTPPTIHEDESHHAEEGEYFWGEGDEDEAPSF